MTGPQAQRNAPSVPSALRREPRPRDAVQSLERGLLVIRCFAGSGNLTLAQIAERSSLPRSTAGRIADTLVGAGYLLLEGRRYALAPSVLWLGHTHRRKVSVADLCKRPLESVSRTLGTSASVGVLLDTKVEYLSRVGMMHEVSPRVVQGARLPPLKTSIGHLLLAYAPENRVDAVLKSRGYAIDAGKNLKVELEVVRGRGWSYLENVIEMGICAIAVPVLNEEGRVVAAVNASSSTSLRSRLPLVVQTLQEASRDIATRLRDWSPETPIRAYT
nr:IclR family transcriptional regulator [Arthrobacter sp.]